MNGNGSDAATTGSDRDMNYGDYLNLTTLLAQQKPLSEAHDEMLFVIVHQASELWLKLAGHELTSAIEHIRSNQLGASFKVIARVKLILNQLTQSWSILATMTPADYLSFRDVLGSSSGFQSYGYRQLEFQLGNKRRDMLAMHQPNPPVFQKLSDLYHAPSLYDEVIKKLAESGLSIDESVLQRDVTQPYQTNPSVLAAWITVYQNTERYFELYELGEKLVDIEDAVQQWRYKHMYTVQRIIGFKKGTGGSEGVNYLKKALDISFFPELFELRTHL